MSTSLTAASSHRLASALAQRLNAAVPAGFRVTADGSAVHVEVDGQRIGESQAASIVQDRDDRTDAERIETATRAVLDAVQDGVSEHVREPWPATATGAMAMPAARSNSEHVQLWYGSDEHAPALGFPPISVAEVIGVETPPTTGHTS